MIRAGYDPAGAVTPVQQPAQWWVDFDRRMVSAALLDRYSLRGGDVTHLLCGQQIGPAGEGPVAEVLAPLIAAHDCPHPRAAR